MFDHSMAAPIIPNVLTQFRMMQPIHVHKQRTIPVFFNYAESTVAEKNIPSSGHRYSK